MASSSAVQGKTGFFHFPGPNVLQKKKSGATPADTLDATPTPAPNLNKLPKAKPQPLAQGDEAARKNNGLLDCFGCLALLALCCFCCQGNGNNGGRRGWAKTPKNNKPQPETPAPAPATNNTAANSAVANSAAASNTLTTAPAV